MTFKRDRNDQYIKSMKLDDTSSKITIDSWTSGGDCGLVLATRRDTDGNDGDWMETKVRLEKQEVFDVAMALLEQYDTM